MLPQNKTTKYNMYSQLVAVEENPQIRLLIVLIQWEDVEAGLALAEMMLACLSLRYPDSFGGSHSIGSWSVSADYSFIAPSATMTIHLSD